jgi:hypothetical protein
MKRSKMPDFNAAAYANHPIQIPPEFPKILKQYTKAAIRTQPKDLLLWSVAYFRYERRKCLFLSTINDGNRFALQVLDQRRNPPRQGEAGVPSATHGIRTDTR